MTHYVTLEQIRERLLAEELLDEEETIEAQYADIIEQLTVTNFWELCNKFGVTFDEPGQRFRIASLAGLSVCLAIHNAVCHEFDNEINAPGGIWDNFELTGDDNYDYDGQHPRNVLNVVYEILTVK